MLDSRTHDASYADTFVNPLAAALRDAPPPICFGFLVPRPRLEQCGDVGGLACVRQKLCFSMHCAVARGCVNMRGQRRSRVLSGRASSRRGAQYGLRWR